MHSNTRANVLVYGVTVTTTASVLLRGQLGWMRERGWDVHVVASPSPEHDKIAEREGVTFHALPMNRSISVADDLKALIAWIRLLRRLRPEVTNVSTPKAGLLGAVASWLLRVPRRVYLVRGLRLESETGWRRRVLTMMERVTIALSTDVLVVSDSLRDELQKLGVAGKTELKMIGAGSSNGVQADQIRENVESNKRSDQRAALGVRQDSDLVVVFIGRLTPDKGINDLAKAFQSDQLASCTLVTLGDVEDVSVKEGLAKLGKRWIALDWSDDIVPVLSASDVLCLPTYREGMPNVALEAAAAGLPVVTTYATGARDSVIDDETGILVPVRDPDALAAALARLAKDPLLRARMGKAGQARVLAEFRPELIWEGLDKVYRGKPLP